MKRTRIFASTATFLAATALLVAFAPHMLSAEAALDRSPVVATMAASQLTAGDRLASTGAFHAAEKAYLAAAELVRAQGGLPVEEVRRVANAQYYAGEYMRAAKTLEQLADEAAAHNAVTVRFWANVDAARLAQLGGADGYARWYTQQAEWLLESPELSDETRTELRAKLDSLDSTDLVVFAPHLSSW